MIDENHPHTGVGPYKAYVVSVYNRIAPKIPTRILVLGCNNPKAAIMMALRNCHSDSYAIHTSHAIEFDALDGVEFN